MLKDSYLKKFIQNISDNYKTVTFKYIVASALLMFMLYILAFAVITTYGVKIGFNKYAILLDGIFLFLSALVTMLIIFIFFNDVIQKEKESYSEEEFKCAVTYLKELELYAGEAVDFIHEHAIVTRTLEMYLEQNNMKAFKKYYEKKISPISTMYTISDNKLKNFDYIKDKGLKGLVLTKIIYAMEKGIEIKAELTEPIEAIFIDCIDLYRIVGIFIDNAIEAALETEEKELTISMFYRKKKELCIIVKNTTLPIIYRPEQLKKQNISTKGKFRGLGLHIVTELTEKYKNIEWKTIYNKPYFIQKLNLKED